MLRKASQFAAAAPTLITSVLAVTLVAPPAAAAQPASPVSQTTRAAQVGLLEQDLKEECEARSESTTDPGWFADRYTHCRSGRGLVDVFDQRNIPVGQIQFDIVMIGFGNNGAREFNYVVYFDDFKKIGAPNLVLDTVVFDVWFSCDPSLLPCPDPASGRRTDTVAGWRAVDYFSTSLVSADVAGAGPQIVTERLALTIQNSAPGQPFLSGPPVETAAYSNVRFDSASYVGRARGAVFTDYKLVFEVSLSRPDQDESALHIRHALVFPALTFPSWLGKSVPGDDDEPLTRMYNPSLNDANRRKSEALCQQLYGTWNSSQVNCDEFPFASTYEGSKTGPERNGGYNRFSVRLIDAADNQYVGRQLLEVNFYRANRVLDGDRFAVHVVA